MSGCSNNTQSGKDNSGDSAQTPAINDSAQTTESGSTAQTPGTGDTAQTPATNEQEVTPRSSHVFENVIINTYYQEPASLRNKNTVVFDGLGNGEFIEMIVKGEIRDFRHLELKWDEQKNSLTEAGVLNKLDTVTDNTIVIKTYMPEGIPSEKIEWKTTSGKLYEFVIQEDGN